MRCDEKRSRRFVFEAGAAGAAFASRSDWPLGLPESSRLNGSRAALMHDMWCAEAERAVLCWLWAARKLEIAKDIRIKIARLLLAERHAWSESIAGIGKRQHGGGRCVVS